MLYILLLFVLFTLFLLSQNNPDSFFWFFLILFFDPGGFFAGYFSGDIIGPINYSDMVFFLLLMPVLSRGVDKSIVRKDKDFIKFLKLLLPLYIYFIFIYGFLVPLYRNNLDYTTFLVKSRLFFYSYPLLILVYIFAQRKLKVFFNTLVFFSVVVLSLYFITLLANIPIVPIISMSRYKSSDILRIGMYSYGLIQFILPIGILVFLIGKRVKLSIPNKKWIYYSAILMLITLILTLTRREYLRIIVLIVFTTFLLSYLFRGSKIKNSFKVIFGFVFALMFVFVLFPSYFNFLFQLYEDTFLLIATGADTRGVSDYRVTGTGDLQIALDFIKSNLLLGTGYQYVDWANADLYRRAGDLMFLAYDASSEVPIYGVFFRMGILGFIIATPIYIFLLKRIIQFTKQLKVNMPELINYSILPIIFSIFLLVQFYTSFITEFYSLYYEFYEPSRMASFVVVAGLFFATRKNISNQLNEMGLIG